MNEVRLYRGPPSGYVRRMGRNIAWWLLSAVLLAGAGLSYLHSHDPVDAAPLHFSTDTLEVDTDSGKHILHVELATDDAQRERGLMYRKSLAPDKGMLFIFGSTNYVAMWMKNTYVPLDMVFIDGHGRVSRVVADTKPLSESIISSQGLVRAVLEVNAGTAAKLKIEPGSTVRYKVFGNTD